VAAVSEQFFYWRDVKTMDIGVVGAGSMGRVLARNLARLGHRVRIANSRGPGSLAELAAEIAAEPVSVVDAARARDMIILAIPTKSVAHLPTSLFGAASNAVVVDIGNYHPMLRDGRIDALERGTIDSEWVSKQIGKPGIKAFNNILDTSLRDKAAPDDVNRRIALSVMGDSLDAKSVVLGLVDAMGFDPVDAGELSDSWRQQPGTPAYCRDLAATALRQALAAADRNRIAEYRAEREAEIRREIEAQAVGR
jgi:predicted dinucleotide-binding enzyme